MSSAHGDSSNRGRITPRSLTRIATSPATFTMINPLMAGGGASVTPITRNQAGQTSSQKDRIQKTFKRCSSIDVTDSLDEAETTISPTSWREKLKRLHFLFTKYTFVGVNILCIAISVFQLFIANDHRNLWTPDNSLVILGFIFGIILCAIGISGGIKEEFYLVLTYSAFLTIMIFVAVLQEMMSPFYLGIFIVTHALLPYYYAFLLYRQPSPVIILAADLTPATFYNLASKAPRKNSTVKMRSKSIIVRGERGNNGSFQQISQQNFDSTSVNDNDNNKGRHRSGSEGKNSSRQQGRRRPHSLHAMMMMEPSTFGVSTASSATSSIAYV